MFTCKKGDKSRDYRILITKQKKNKNRNFANGDVFLAVILMWLEQSKFNMSLLSLTKFGPRPQVENY